MGVGLSRDKCLDITGLSKHQFYRPACAKKPGRQGSETTRYKDPLTSAAQEFDNERVLEQIIGIKSQPDLPNWYRMITRHLQLAGYYINHKKYIV